MRRIAAAFSTFLVAASLLFSSAIVSATPDADSTVPTLTQCQTMVKTKVLSAGHLTVATDRPAYKPWFVNDNPSNRQGYESALTYALAAALGFSAHNVRWVTEPYAISYVPGNKPFDFDINEIVLTPARAKDVTFSHSYFDLHQSLVAMRSDPIVRHHSPTALTTYRYGVIANTPAVTYVTTHVKPAYPIVQFNNVTAAVTSLETGAIDAIVIDTPTGNLLVKFQLVDSGGTALATQVGQFPAVGDEYYAMVLQKRNPLLACLDVALTAVRRSGQLHTFTTKWLGIYTRVPLLTP